MYVDFSAEATTCALSIRVTLHELTNTFMGLNFAAAKPGEPSGLPQGLGLDKGCSSAFPVLTGASRLVTGRVESHFSAPLFTCS